MSWIIGTRAAAIALVGAAALVAGQATAAEGTFVNASIDSTSNSQTRLDGSVATATAAAGGNFASVAGDLTHMHVFGADTAHYSAGAPGSVGNSDFAFEILGAVGPVDLTFHFGTTGSFNADTGVDFARSGGFAIDLLSSTGTSPYVHGNFADVNCNGCGGRLFNGQITVGEDAFGPGSVTTTPWLGANPGDFALHSSFEAGAPLAGHLQLMALGSAGNANWDFEVALQSISVSGGGQGLRLRIPSTGQFLEISDSAAAAPEPAAWSLMILGFGAAGAMLRRRRSMAVAV